MTEQWRPIPGYEGVYEVSDQGRVRSLDRAIQQRSRSGLIHNHTHKGRVLRPGPALTGHLTVVLGRGNTQSVHTLVLLAFVGPRPKGKECLHRNGNPADNSLENLRWGTRTENILDAVKHGTWESEKRRASRPIIARKAWETKRGRSAVY